MKLAFSSSTSLPVKYSSALEGQLSNSKTSKWQAFSQTGLVKLPAAALPGSSESESRELQKARTFGSCCHAASPVSPAFAACHRQPDLKRGGKAGLGWRLGSYRQDVLDVSPCAASHGVRGLPAALRERRERGRLLDAPGSAALNPSADKTHIGSLTAPDVRHRLDRHSLRPKKPNPKSPPPKKKSNPKSLPLPENNTPSPPQTNQKKPQTHQNQTAIPQTNQPTKQNPTQAISYCKQCVQKSRPTFLTKSTPIFLALPIQLFQWKRMMIQSQIHLPLSSLGRWN